MNQESVGRWAPKRNAMIVLAALIAVGALAWVVTHAGSNEGKSGGRGRPSTTVGIAQGRARRRARLALGHRHGAADRGRDGAHRSWPASCSACTSRGAGRPQGPNARRRSIRAPIRSRWIRREPIWRATRRSWTRRGRPGALSHPAREDSIARQQVDTQAATVKQPEGTVGADHAAVGTARLNLDYTSITAPVSGRVGLRQADIGNYVTPSDANGIVVITETDPIDVAFALPQDQLPKVQAQSQAGRPAGDRDRPGGHDVLAKGRVPDVRQSDRRDHRHGEGQGALRQADGSCFPISSSMSRCWSTRCRTRSTVPVTAVRHGAQGDFVFLLQPDRTAKLSVVKTGPIDRSARSPSSPGVQLGDTVITEGADRLDDGATVSCRGDARLARAAASGCSVPVERSPALATVHAPTAGER